MNMAEAEKSEDWVKELGSRGATQLCTIPHIPILLEDLPKYVLKLSKDSDYISRIQTIGKLIPQKSCSTTALLRTYSSNNFTEIKLDLSSVRSSNMYREENDTILMISELQNNSVFKVYGVLKQEYNNITLLVDNLVKIENAEPMLKLFKTLSMLACRRISQYGPNAEQERT